MILLDGDNVRVERGAEDEIIEQLPKLWGTSQIRWIL